MRNALIAMALAILSGCNSLRVSQVNHFSDNEGSVVKVEFCRAKKDHTVKFTAPNGKELDSLTKLAVRVEMPDGDDFTAWKTLNPRQLQSGTAYKTDDGEFMFWAHGFNCIVFKFDEKANDYAFIFEGILIKN